MANGIDHQFIVKSVVRAMIDVLGIHASHIDTLDMNGNTLIRVGQIPYLSTSMKNDVITIKSIQLDNTRGMLQMHRLLCDQFNESGYTFVLSA